MLFHPMLAMLNFFARCRTGPWFTRNIRFGASGLLRFRGRLSLLPVQFTPLLFPSVLFHGGTLGRHRFFDFRLALVRFLRFFVLGCLLLLWLLGQRGRS